MIRQVKNYYIFVNPFFKFVGNLQVFQQTNFIFITLRLYPSYSSNHWDLPKLSYLTSSTKCASTIKPNSILVKKLHVRLGKAGGRLHIFIDELLFSLNIFVHNKCHGYTGRFIRRVKVFTQCNFVAREGGRLCNLFIEIFWHCYYFNLGVAQQYD